jgi:hypothetical protein
VPGISRILGERCRSQGRRDRKVDQNFCLDSTVLSF